MLASPSMSIAFGKNTFYMVVGIALWTLRTSGDFLDGLLLYIVLTPNAQFYVVLKLGGIRGMDE